jgi:hypothetical protein
MATVGDVAKRSLQLLLIQGDEAALEPSEYQDYITQLNYFMDDLAANGIDLSWTSVTGVADTMPVVDGALRGIAACMAVDIAPEYGVTVTPELAKQATTGMETLRKLGMTQVETRFPSTLPVGSGNYDNTFNDDWFYPDSNDGIRNGTIT